MKKILCFMLIFTTSITCKADFSNNQVEYSFNRLLARQYMNKYWENYNENYYNFSDIGGDCTNYASQIMHYSGIPFTEVVEFPTYNQWYYYGQNWGTGRSSTWTSATEFRKYFGDIDEIGAKTARSMETYTVNEAILEFDNIWRKIQVGDIVSHGHSLDSSYHTQIVYDFTLFQKDILVSQHSANYLNRSLYSYLEYRQRSGMGEEFVYIIYM